MEDHFYGQPGEACGIRLRLVSSTFLSQVRTQQLAFTWPMDVKLNVKLAANG